MLDLSKLQPGLFDEDQIHSSFISELINNYEPIPYEQAKALELDTRSGVVLHSRFYMLYKLPELNTIDKVLWGKSVKIYFDLVSKKHNETVLYNHRTSPDDLIAYGLVFTTASLTEKGRYYDTTSVNKVLPRGFNLIKDDSEEYSNKYSNGWYLGNIRLETELLINIQELESSKSFVQDCLTLDVLNDLDNLTKSIVMVGTVPGLSEEREKRRKRKRKIEKEIPNTLIRSNGNLTISGMVKYYEPITALDKIKELKAWECTNKSIPSTPFRFRFTYTTDKDYGEVSKGTSFTVFIDYVLRDDTKYLIFTTQNETIQNKFSSGSSPISYYEFFDKPNKHFNPSWFLGYKKEDKAIEHWITPNRGIENKIPILFDLETGKADTISNFIVINEIIPKMNKEKEEKEEKVIFEYIPENLEIPIDYISYRKQNKGK